MGTVNNYSPLSYKIIRRKRKTIGIKITEEGEIIVFSPLNISEKTIDTIVKSKEKWIRDKLEEIDRIGAGQKKKEFKAGETLLYLGEFITLEVLESNARKSSGLISNNTIKVFVSDGIERKEHIIRDTVINVYKQEAKRTFTERTNLYSRIIEVRPQRIVIKDQKTLWGSCSSKGNINYNYRLIMAPVEIIDYVVVHELCHLKHMNHSKEYWKVVQSVLPDYKERRLWLKVNGNKLRI